MVVCRWVLAAGFGCFLWGWYNIVPWECGVMMWLLVVWVGF